MIAALTCASGTLPVSAALLDDVPGASAAYSLRKLRDGYSGSAITVRRSSDDTTQNIGFDVNGNLDTTALLNFVGSGNGFVTTWFDQSASGLNVTQTESARQPQIVASGVTVKASNGSLALRFQGANNTGASATADLLSVGVDAAFYGSSGLTVTAAAAFSVEPVTTQIVQRFFSLHDGDSTRLTMGGNNGKFAVGYRVSSSPTFSDTSFDPSVDQTFVGTLVANSAPSGSNDTINAYANGTSVFTASGLNLETADDTLVIGSLTAAGARSLSGTMNEIIFFGSVLPTDSRTTVESSMITAYVPEPGSAALLAAAVVPMMLRRRRIALLDAC